MQKTIWIYWENKYSSSMPGYINLCKQSIDRYRGDWDLVELNPANVGDYVKNLRPDFSKIPEVAHKADYIRAAVLAENGGMWMDVDTIVFRPLSLITDLLFDSGAVFYGWKPRQPSVGLIAARENHPLIVAWLDSMNKVLDQSLNQKWAGIGYNILWPLAENIDFTQIDRSICAPTHYTETDLFGSTKPPQDVLDKNTVLMQLYNKMLFPKMGHLTVAEVRKSSTLLSALFDLSESPDYAWEAAAKKATRDKKIRFEASSLAARNGCDLGTAYIQLVRDIAEGEQSSGPVKRILNSVRNMLP